MADPHPHFRNPAEEAAYKTVEDELAARIQRRDYVPEAERDGWRQTMFPLDDRWSSVRELEACRAFREPLNPASAVIADAMVRAGTVSDGLYARMLTVADRRFDAQPVTRAVAFDAFGTLVHIGRKRHPFERLIRQTRNRPLTLLSPMVRPIGLADYAAALGLPHPTAELAALDEELATIALYPDTLDALRRVRDQGVKVAVASNLAQPYAAPLRALLGDLVDVWHFSFDAGVIKPDRAFYAGLTAKLNCEASELLMVGDTWAADVVGAVEAGLRACWLARDGRASHVRRYIAARSLDDVGRDLRTVDPGDTQPKPTPKSQMTEAELAHASIDANIVYLHEQRWAVEEGRLRNTVEKAPPDGKPAAEQALRNHYETRDRPELSRAALMQSALDHIERR